MLVDQSKWVDREGSWSFQVRADCVRNAAEASGLKVVFRPKYHETEADFFVFCLAVASK